LQLGRDPGNTQLGAFGEKSFADEVKIALDPFIIEVADFSDLKVDLNDFLRLVTLGVIESDFQDALGYGKFMHF